MIELVTVELTNFRSFSHGTFEPLGIGQGMTAINGANGMGKSSVVHGIVWALYGVTPDGVRVGALRRQDSEGDTEVKVTIRHDGQTIIVTRAIRGRNDTTVASIEVDGVEQTNVSSRTATNWIVNRLGLDSEAFLTAFVVRQKELDSLVRARPAERRKTIERLAGIERMSKALELSRAEARLAQKTYESLPPIVNSEALKSEKAQLEKHLSNIESENNTKNAELNAIKNRVADIRVTLSESQKLEQQIIELENRIDLEEARLSDLEEKVEAAQKIAVLAEDSDALFSEQTQIDTQIIKSTEELESAQNLERQANQSKQKQDEISKVISDLEKEKENLDQSILGADIAKLEKNIEELKQDLEIKKELEASLADSKGAARGEWDRLKKAIDTLELHSHDSEQALCPTCSNEILDVEILISSLNASLSETEDKGKKINFELSEVKTFIVNLSNEFELLQNKLKEHATLSARADLVSKELVKELDSLAEETDSYKKLSSNKIDPKKALEKKEKLEKRQRELIALLAKIENAVVAKNALPNLKSDLELKQKELSDYSKKYEEVKAATIKYDTISLEEDLASNSEQLIHIGAQIREMETTLAIGKNQIENIESSLDKLTIEEERRAALLRDVEAKTAAATTLDEFRKDRLARLTPELSEVASDFVSRMTDGKYTSVLLDEDFTPILTDASGAERPIAWLSGGEESAVALALRVAIGEVLAGQRGGLLILDEALTAQDTSRRQSTMGAIRMLPRQVITINHVSEATDMVDLVAEIVSAEDGSSTIQDMVPENGKINSVSDEMIDA